MMKKRNCKSVACGLLVGVLINSIFWGTPNSKANTDYGLQNPRITITGQSTWDCVYFGSYWQSDTNGDGVADQKDEKEPIKWRVLSVEGNNAFLLSDKILDTRLYSNTWRDVQWENSSIRDWLNETFLNDAFSEEEQTAISETLVVNEEMLDENVGVASNTKDKVYLLSEKETQNTAYGFSPVRIEGITAYYGDTSSNLAQNTKYAIDSGVLNDDGNGSWWLRTIASYYYRRACCIDERGTRDREYVVGSSSLCTGTENPRPGVRPALNINLELNQWEEAGIVTTVKQPEETPAPEKYETSSDTPLELKKEIKKSSISPRKVKGVRLKSKKKRIMVSWKQQEMVDGFKIQYARDKRFTKKKGQKIVKGSSCKAVINKLKKGKVYYVRIKAFNKSNGKRIFGKWSIKKKIVLSK